MGKDFYAVLELQKEHPHVAHWWIVKTTEVIYRCVLREESYEVRTGAEFE